MKLVISTFVIGKLILPGTVQLILFPTRRALKNLDWLLSLSLVPLPPSMDQIMDMADNLITDMAGHQILAMAA